MPIVRKVMYDDCLVQVRAAHARVFDDISLERILHTAIDIINGNPASDDVVMNCIEDLESVLRAASDISMAARIRYKIPEDGLELSRHE